MIKTVIVAALVIGFGFLIYEKYGDLPYDLKNVDLACVEGQSETPENGDYFLKDEEKAVFWLGDGVHEDYVELRKNFRQSGIESMAGTLPNSDSQRETFIDSRIFIPLSNMWSEFLLILMGGCISALIVKANRVQQHINPLNIKTLAVFMTVFLPCPTVLLALQSSEWALTWTWLLCPLTALWLLSLSFCAVYSLTAWSR